MLSVWVGRAGSGKSRRVLEAMEKNRGLRRQVLLVPEHISHEAEVDLCRALGPTASRDAEVLSFRSLSSRVLAETGGLAEFTLDNGGKLLTMRRVLQELAPELRVFGRPSQRASFLRQLTDLMEELYAYEIGTQDLYAHVEDLEGAMGDKLRDIALLYAAYDARLRNGDMDARSRLQKLREHLEHSDYLRGCDVYLDGFSYFNRQEESILELVLRQASSVTVTLLGDRGNEQLFQNALRQRMRLERMARRVGQSMEVLWCEKQGSGPLDHLERHFFGRETAYEGQAEGIRLYQAATAFTEVEWVSQQLRQLAAEGYRWRDMGVCARNMEVYGPLLESVFRRDGIPAYISRRSDLLEKPPITMLLGALDAVTGGFDREDVFRCLKTGLGGISPDECDILETRVGYPGRHVAAGGRLDRQPRRLRTGDDGDCRRTAAAGQWRPAAGTSAAGAPVSGDENGIIRQEQGRVPVHIFAGGRCAPGPGGNRREAAGREPAPAGGGIRAAVGDILRGAGPICGDPGGHGADG